jgi:hypothetical protein
MIAQSCSTDSPESFGVAEVEMPQSVWSGLRLHFCATRDTQPKIPLANPYNSVIIRSAYEKDGFFSRTWVPVIHPSDRIVLLDIFYR